MSSTISKHPEELEILRLLDGDLPGAEARAINRHLESCWHCRKERNEIQAAIDAFVRYRESVFLPHLPPPPQSWPDFRRRCEESDLSTTPVLPRHWPVWRFAAAGLFGLALLATTIILRQQTNGDATVPKAVMATPAAPKAAPVKSVSIAKKVESLPQRSLLAVEVEVLHALHLAGADLGEPIEVARFEREVLVKATELDPLRAETIRRAIAAIPGARFVLSDPPRPQTAAAGIVPQNSVPPRPILFASSLRAREEFANAALDMGDAITARAFAWNKLEMRFSGQPLPAREAETIRNMQDAHRDALRRQAVELRKLLKTVFPEQEVPTAAPRPLARTARDFDEAISAAFAGAQSRHSDAELLALLQRLLQELAQ